MTQAGALRISIVIPAYNEARLLERTLQTIQQNCSALAAAGFTTELIVCDNNSTDATAAIAAAQGARVVFEPINQIARARNRGAAAATGAWLLFIDADSLPSAALFAEVAAAIRSGRCLAGGCTLQLQGRHRAAHWLTRGWNWLSRARRLLAGSFIFIEKSTFMQIGGFSEELFTGEELDLSRRLRPRARETQRRILILHRHPLLTSDRKMHLYSGRELLGFLLYALFRPHQAMRNKQACFAWYDGRR
ncbi:MAG TPA: glycosyltransferase [Verrucomicrobiota bacterium]|nr:glycosyltransferase [Verrucomicrobiota bacterium]HNT16013.1 glycosyltransferase [Verrucomicrobiota bacterium]